MIALVVGGLMAGSVVLGLIIGRGIRIADEALDPKPPVPPRLDPRAGQYTAQAVRTTFTTLLALAVVAGVGVAQDVFDATGGVQ